ncbi:hypothetical protein O7635_14650 [Asanoa sp. WMMD1127]|uniref:SCO7613 C-terminal domain-containing membrane protein n=1 Tax=Asanoa sp. WMMD1127 TaxID=3016107 RepID=UPI002415E394|nr:hypothetical protein [Asanoa sp. WMMD1127]MDG4823092.1 hypothetical protein [Asanoa sp. WMMD1127]
MTYPCPSCQAPASLETGCPNCGRGPDPAAAEVLRLNAEIAALTPSVEEARRAYADLSARLGALHRRREEVAARVRAAAFVSAAPAPVSARPETSPRTAQNVLFVLGGLLVGAAAIVFTGVAWATYGAVGRAVALAVVTALVLAVPPLATRRGLRSTAETFAALGMLLVVLDGYAAWYANLLGLAAVDGAGYAAVVCAVTAGVGAAYGRATGLTGPGLAALVLLQPVPPLLAAWLGADTAATWSLAFATVAALDLALLRLLAARPARVVAWIGFGCALVSSGVCALGVLLVFASAPPLLTGLPTLLVALLLAAAGPVGRVRWLGVVGAAAVPPALAIAVLRPVAELRDSVLLIAAAGVVLLIALASLRVPAGRLGAQLTAGAFAVVPGLIAVTVAVATLGASLPPFAGDGITAADLPSDWQLPAALLLGAVALALVVPSAFRTITVTTGVLLALLALPTWVSLPWWAVSTVDLFAAAALVVAARRALVFTAASATLAAHAVLVALARPWSAAAALGVVALLGVVAVVRAARGAAWWCAAGLAAVPAAAAATVYAAGAVGAWPARAGLAAVAFPLAATIWFARAPRLTGYAGPATIALSLSAGVAGIWPALSTLDEPAGVYPSLALLALAAAATHVAKPPAVRPGRRSVAAGRPDTKDEAAGPSVRRPDAPALQAVRQRQTEQRAFALRMAAWVALGVAAVPVAVVAAFAAVPALAVLLLAPYGWWDEAWSGMPDGVGLTPAGTAVITAGPAATLLILAAASLAFARRPRLAPQTAHGSPVAASSAEPVDGPPADGPASSVEPGGGPAADGGASSVEPGGGSRADGAASSDASAGAADDEGAAPSWIGAALVVAGFLGVSGLLAVLAAAEVPWPVVPAFALAAGLVAGIIGAERRKGAIVAAPVVLLIAAGFSGLLPTAGSTLGALGALIATGALAGATGATTTARIVGWLTAVGAGAGFAVAAVAAADLPLRHAAFPVVGVGALALGLGHLLNRRGRRGEGRAVDAVGHVAIGPALALAWADPRMAAAVATVWGAVLGIRAVLPGERARTTLAFAAAASELLAWWLLLAGWDVALREAHTLPAAALALAAGLVAIRRQRLGSWLALGPGLAAALLPSLTSVLIAGGQVERRLLLGAGAVVVVLVGAHWRWQAPVVAGGLTLVVLTVHELAVWDLLPRWAYLAGGGLLLIAVAMTYERRLRDLRKIRGTLARMT